MRISYMHVRGHAHGLHLELSDEAHVQAHPWRPCATHRHQSRWRVITQRSEVRSTGTLPENQSWSLNDKLLEPVMTRDVVLASHLVERLEGLISCREVHPIARIAVPLRRAHVPAEEGRGRVA